MTKQKWVQLVQKCSTCNVPLKVRIPVGMSVDALFKVKPPAIRDFDFVHKGGYIECRVNPPRATAEFWDTVSIELAMKRALKETA